MTHIPYYQPGHPTLNQVLKLLGYTTAPSKFGSKDIIRGGVIAHSGYAGAAWKWLRESGQWTAES